jgi:uncharacterized membrane protein YoaK (UPF0700 family)
MNLESQRLPAIPAERSLSVALLLTTTGGFLDAFTYVGHGRVFANTMTANVVFLATFIASAQWISALHILPTILAFMFGVFLAYRARNPVFLRSIRRPALVCLILEIGFLAIVSILPGSFPAIILVPGIALVAAIQNSIFTQVESWVYNSVMTTGNLRGFAESLYSGAVFKRDPKAMREASVFGAICFCFGLGAGIGALATHHTVTIPPCGCPSPCWPLPPICAGNRRSRENQLQGIEPVDQNSDKKGPSYE